MDKIGKEKIEIMMILIMIMKMHIKVQNFLQQVK